MKKPSTQSMMMGHPVVALPVAVATLATLYAWSQNSEVWWLAIVMLAFMGRVMKANEARRDYLQWKREWDAMDPNPALRMRAVHVAGMVGSALLLVAGAASDQVGLGAAVGGLILGAFLWLMLWGFYAAWKQRPRHRARTATPVRLAITRPVLPALSLADCYAALPAHSRAVLDASR
ncbi:MAG: hypothetical protein ACK4Z8_09865 [Novosphingobium sp.]